MKNSDIRIGMYVRYAPERRAEGEEKYIHKVIENRMNPCTGEMTRWLIETVNSGLFIPPYRNSRKYNDYTIV